MEGENLTEANLRETTFGLKNLEFRKIVASNNRDAVFFFFFLSFSQKKTSVKAILVVITVHVLSESMDLTAFVPQGSLKKDARQVSDNYV